MTINRDTFTIDDYQKAKENTKKFRLKVSYKEDHPEDEYRFDLKRAIEESK